ncbi:MAG: sigma-70 family RNA polymerase sigma factor [Alphaproteobacteria bacterium]|jgi:RNA polymerase sigma-70 factor (ECF subfamily)|nr:sigma-70 family RNA polymerase sigma factor [Alphaproteobacteria bacterium]
MLARAGNEKFPWPVCGKWIGNNRPIALYISLTATDGKGERLDTFLQQLEQWSPNLRRYARALTRNAEQADDLVQDCLERALSRRHLWNEDGNTRAWLFTIMHNIHANDTRRRGSRPASVPIDDQDGHYARPASQHSRIAGMELAAALDELPADQRQVILLVALEGMSYGEVAETVGVAAGTVMSRLSRGRERLRRLMEEGAQALRVVK